MSYYISYAKRVGNFMNKKFVDVVLVIVGNVLIAIGVTAFIMPYNILSGGLAGIAIAIYPMLNIDPTIFVNIMTLVLFFLGWIFLGKQFALKTAVSTVVYPLALILLKGNIPVIQCDPLLASLYGGLLAGCGAGLAMRTGASTGGMNVLTMIFHKYTPFSIPALVFAIDAVTVALGLFTFGIESVLIGFIAVWAGSQAVDKMLLMGTQDAKAVQIISPKYNEISKAIQEQLARGTTLIHAEGGYSHEDRKVVLAVIGKNQYHFLTRLVTEIDSDAFIIMSDTSEVKGLGFSYEFKV